MPKCHVLLCAGLVAFACNDDKSEEAVSAVTTEGAFPLGLALASPFSRAETPPNALSVPASQYDWSAQAIEDALAGTAAETISPDQFLNSGASAPCYGPAIKYENHPDGEPSTGTVGGGDVGMWLATDPSGDACVVAQLNSRLQGMEAQFHQALVIAATLVGVANTAGVLPTAGTTSDITAELAASWTDVTVSSATLSLASSGTWSYEASFVYVSSMAGKSYPTTIQLSHTPGASSAAYSGILSFQATGDSDDFGGNNCQDGNRTLNGSLAYRRDSSTAMITQARAATFCGAGVDGRNSDGVLDADMRYVPDAEPNGWSENFSIFAADFDPETLGGSYAYAWQAGAYDGMTRVLNVGVNSFADGTLDGEGYFGFGDAIQDDADGVFGVQGFICNWSGPSADHTLLDYAQRQFFDYNASSGFWALPSADASEITYAPVNGCAYDGSGSFLFDSDADGDLSDENNATVTVTEPDLMTPGNGTCTATTIWDTITSCRGYDEPAAP